MDTIVNYINTELNMLTTGGKKYKTSDVRRLSSKVYKKIKTRTFEEKLEICEGLLEVREWAFGVIAYDIAFRERKNYTHETFDIFEKWLINYVRGWGDCDDFCTHAFGALLAQNNDLFDKVIKWCDSDLFWVRRAAAVILIYPIKKDKIEGINPFEISDRLMRDEHDLVLKGYGWMLKIFSEKEPKRIEEYLVENINDMPRVSFRYALEKLDKETRKRLMKIT